MGDYHPQQSVAMKLAGAYINDETYGRLAALAAANNRTLAGQCRHLFDRALKGDLEVPDGPVARAARAAAAHSLPGCGVVPKRRTLPVGPQPSGIPDSVNVEPVLPDSDILTKNTLAECGPAGGESPTAQAVRKVGSGRGGSQGAERCVPGCCTQAECGGCAQGAGSFQPDRTTMHNPTMNTQPSGGKSQRTPRRNPR